MSNKNSYKFKNLDLVGERHGRLTVLSKSKNGRSRWICKCDCGNVVELPTFRFFEYKSCGCLEKENKKHYPKKQPHIMPLIQGCMAYGVE